VVALLLLAQQGPQPEMMPLPLTRVQAEDLVDQVGREYIEMKAELEPHWATVMGIPGHDGDLARYNQRDISRMLRRVFGMKRRLESFVPDSLSISAWVDHEVLLTEIATFEYWFSGDVAYRRSPLPYTDAIIQGITSLMLSGPDDSLSVHLASRLAAIPGVVAEARVNITDPLKVQCEVAAADLRAFTPALDPASLLGYPAIDATVVTPEAVGAARAQVETFAGFIDSLAAIGTVDYALGPGTYAVYLKTAYMLEEPLDNLVADAGRVLAQAAAVKVEKPATPEAREGPLDQMTPRLKDRVSQYQAAMMNALNRIRYGGLLNVTNGDERVEVRPVPPLVPPVGEAFYWPPEPSGGEPTGTVFVDTLATGGEAGPTARVWCFAEPVRSHYPALQPAEVRLDRNPSAIRRYIRSSVGRDGWEFYFNAIQSRADLAYRAASAIAEIKIHAREFTLTEAADYIAAETERPRDLALEDARRYAVAPGSGIGYLIGRREILRLKERYEKVKGEAFDLKQFHDTLLSCGYLPPYLLSIEVMSKGMGRE
jgi:hypothetical protein